MDKINMVFKFASDGNERSKISMSRIRRNSRSQRKPRNLKGSYRRIIIRKGLLDRLKDFIIYGQAHAQIGDALADPYGDELDRAWKDFESRKYF